MAIVLELLSRNNLPIKHYKFDQDYVCVGRDFNNDLRLDDPYVCPSHMLVAIDPESGLLMVNDCQSTNGIKLNNKYVKQSTLTPNDVIKIGRTRLRIIDTKAPLPKAIPLSELEENLNWLNKTLLTVVLTAACLAFMLVSKFINTVDEFKLLSVLPSELGKLALFSIWPLLFAVLAKVVKTDSHMVNQINLSLLFLLVCFILGQLQNVIVFNLTPGLWFDVLEFGVFATLLAGFIWLTLFIAFHQPSLRRNMITGLLSVAVLGPLFVFSFVNTDEFSSRPSYNLKLLPPMYNFTGAMDTGEFIEHSKSLFQQADKPKS